MLTSPLMVHLWITALRARRGFEISIAVRDVELIYPEVQRPRARA